VLCPFLERPVFAFLFWNLANFGVFFVCVQIDGSPKSCGSGSDSSVDSDTESFDAKISDEKFSKSKHIKQEVPENLCSISPLGE